MRFACGVITVSMAAALCGCAPVRTVTFVVTEPPPGDQPVHAAHLRVVVLDRGPVPLPLNGTTINEILTNGLATSGATRADGRVRLELAKDVPHLVEVIAPPIGPGSSDDNSRGVWVLSSDGVTLEAQERETLGTPLTVRVDR